MRKFLTAALATAILAGGVWPATSAFAGVFGGPGNFASGGNGPPPPPPGFNGPDGFANPPGGGGGGGAWPMPKGPSWGFGITIAPTITHSPEPQIANAWAKHVSWCDKRWKTYDPDSDMYMSKNGPRYCISPMSPYLN